MSDNIRIKTTPGGGEKKVNLQVNQKFDFIEILSLKISQDEAYRRFCSDYGVVVGRVIVNNGVGVPNAKVSIFIPVDEVDAEDPELLGMYPYKEITTTDSDGIPYNLVPRNNRGKDECFTPIGTFPSKREIQDNPLLGEVYCKYYKFTTTTNESGDFMLFGVPVGTHFMHVDADISDIGILSQRPYDLIRDGAPEKSFVSPNKFKGRKESTVLNQLKTTSPISVTVPPFWGDTEQCSIGIARSDVNLATNITPTAIFMGSIISDNDKHALNKKCRPRKKLGKMDEIVTGDGSIEMIRKTFDGGIERFDVEGGQVIDEDGAWAYQIPMNLDYMVTAEDGSFVPSGDPSKGIPTSARVRFRIGMMIDGDEGRLRTRAKYLVPHNPTKWSKVDFTFDTSTNDENFRSLSWNNIYTVKNHITRVQPNGNVENRNFIGLKNVDDSRSRNPFPFNKMDNDTNALFTVLCIIIRIIARLVNTLNAVLIPLLNIVMFLLNGVLKAICGVMKTIGLAICALQFRKNKPECRNKYCIGTLTGGVGCDCKEILSYLPFIVLPCNTDNGKTLYAPGGLDSGNGFEATEDEYAGETVFYANNPPEHECDLARKATIAGCDGGWSDCQATILADALDVFKFDFYNDWINGTLYAFLLKYKKKRNGKEKFCEVDCDDFNSDSDNNCKNNFIVDSCTIAPPQEESDNNREGVNSKRTIKIKSGYIKNYEGELYYSPITAENDSKLFATDIVNLGSVFDCSWNGDSKFYHYLTDTTANLPPLISEQEEIGGTSFITTTGYDLFGNISCAGLSTSNNNCNNLKRICELGVGLDESRESPSSPADTMITNRDVEQPKIRGIFSELNSPLVSTIEDVFIDSTEGSINYKDATYSNFRAGGLITPSNSTFWNKAVWVYDNSYYFYFGLNKGNTALSKMKRKYFTKCVPEQDVDFYIVSNTITDNDATATPTGSISIDVIGGIGPYTFLWNQLTEGGVSYPATNDTQDISGLIAGTYTVTVTDDNGNIANGSFIVPGPSAVSCNIQGTNLTSNGSSDGKISVNLNGGEPEYDVKLHKYDGTAPIMPALETGETSDNIIFDGLEADVEYIVIVTDKTEPTPSQCQDTITLTQPTALSATLTPTDVTCNGKENGKIIVTDDGGIPPFIYEWDSGQTTKNISDLGPGTYTLTITDDNGNGIPQTFAQTIDEPTAISYTTTSVNGNCGGSVGKITVSSISGGKAPYKVTIQGGETSIDETEIDIPIGGSATFDNLSQGIGADEYQITVEDDNGCAKGDAKEVFSPATPLSVTLTPIGGSSATGSINTTINKSFNVSINGGIYEADVYEYEIKVERKIGSGSYSSYISTTLVSGTSYSFNDTYTSSTAINTSYTYKVTVYDKNGDSDGCNKFVESTINVSITE